MTTPNLRTVLTLLCGATLLTACPDDTPPEETTTGEDSTGTTTNSTVTVNPTTVTVTDTDTPATDSTTMSDPDTTAGPATDSGTTMGGATDSGTTMGGATDSGTTMGGATDDSGTTTMGMGSESGSSSSGGGMVLPCVDVNLGSALPVSEMSSNVATTNDFMASCAFMGGDDNDVTFQWTAPADGTYVFDTFGSPIDTILTLVSDCMGTEIDCNDDAGDGLQSELTLTMMAGEVVLINVDGWNETGDFVLNITEDGGMGMSTGMMGSSGGSGGMMGGAGFGDCATMDPAVACTMDELCLVDSADPAMQTVGVCTFIGCAAPADCPAAPPGGTAPVICADINGDMVAEECTIDCSAGQTCPTGMTCFAGFVCAWPV